MQIIAKHSRQPETLQTLEKILSKFEGNPELINDHISTAPSKRLKKLFSDFGKTSDGLQIIDKIPIEVLRKQCYYFNQTLQLFDNLK